MSVKQVQYNDGFAEKWIRHLSPAEWRGRVAVQFLDVPLSSLECAGCWTDAEVVQGWCRTLNDGGAIPPPVAVLTERGTYYLHDGNHRFEALQHFFAGEQQDRMVRIALAVPLPGYLFAYRWLGEYGTYVLQNRPRRFVRTAQITSAIGASALAIGSTALLSGVAEAPFFVFFVLSVMIAAWLGGYKAGLLASFTNLAGAAYFLLPPCRSLLVSDAGHAVQLGVTAVSMIAVAFFMQLVRQHPSVDLGLPDWHDSAAVQSRPPRTQGEIDSRT